VRSAAQQASALGKAKHMRSNPTDAEHRLWQILRAKRLNGWKFRRQPRMGRCTPDFACHEAKLIVEADGGHHGGEADARRDAWFNSQGFGILRFWNNDIFNNEEGVLTVIMAALAASAAASSRDGRTPLSNLSPTRGERQNGASHG
jgi:very-short-patch-repair endonuclease